MVEYCSPADLQPAAYNPRRISEQEFDALCRSIKHLGFVLPIIARGIL